MLKTVNDLRKKSHNFKILFIRCLCPAVVRRVNKKALSSIGTCYAKQLISKGFKKVLRKYLKKC